MAESITTEAGTTVALVDGIVTLDHPAAPADMRNLEAGRVFHGGFQPAPFAEYAMTPAVLVALAALIESTRPEPGARWRALLADFVECTEPGGSTP